MTTITKGLLAFGVVAGVFGLAAFLGLTPFLKVETRIEQLAGASQNGTTFNTAKVAAVTYYPFQASASSTSILNTDVNARYILDNFVDCSATSTGQGLTIQAATTSVASLGLQGNANLIMNTFGTTSSTGTNWLAASSTPPALGGVGVLWPSNTYLTFISTSSVLTQGACTVGVHYLGS